MYDTVERIRRVELRKKELDYRRDRRSIGSLSSLSLVLGMALMTVIHTIIGDSLGQVQGAYGAMLLYEDAGGYVLVGLLSFIAAVLITISCVKWQRKENRDREKFTEEEQS
jgi:hypothetical protein